MEQNYAIKLNIQGIIVSLIAAIIHNENNALCSHSVQTSPMKLVTNTDCSPKQQTPIDVFSERFFHYSLQNKKQNGRYTVLP